MHPYPTTQDAPPSEPTYNFSEPAAFSQGTPEASLFPL